MINVELRYRDGAKTCTVERADSVNIETALKEAMTIDGAAGVSLVDWDSGMSLGNLGGGNISTWTSPPPATRRSSGPKGGQWSNFTWTTLSKTF
jgi:hypothetical protein